MKNFFRVILLVLLSTQISAQEIQKGSISGIVKGSDGKPVSDAVIQVKDSKIVSICDDDGYFKTDALPYNSYTLLISLLGAKTKSVLVEVNSPNVSLEVVFEDDTKEVQEVTIHGKTEKREMEELGYAVNVIETKSVELQSIQANELLDRSAGVKVRQAGGLGSNIQYNINGLTGNSIRIFIDGIPISAYGPSFSLNSIPNTMIERIEVFKGVVPAHLSDDALGGAINVVLKKSIQNSLNASYSYGSFNTHQANINGGYRNNNNGFTARASAFYNYSDNNYEVWGDKVYITNESGKVQRINARRFHDSYRSIGTKLDVGLTNLKWADQFLVGAVLSDMTKDVQHGATMEIVYGNRRAIQNTQLYSLTYSKKNFLIKGLDVSVFSSYSFLNRQVLDTIPYMYNWNGKTMTDRNGKLYEWSSGAEGSKPTLQTSLEKNLTSRINLSYKLTANQNLNFNYIRTGFTRDQDDVMLPDAERAMIDTRYLNKSILAAAIESKYFRQRLKTSLFFKHYTQNIRLKDYTKDRSNNLIEFNHNTVVATPGYGLAMSYSIIRNIMLTASAEHSVRLPESTEVFGNSAENIDPSYGLVPEQSRNINLGFNLGPFLVKKHCFNFITNFFSRNVFNMIAQGLPTSQVSETFSFQNLESVLSKGLDAELIYNFNQKVFYTLGGSYSNPVFNTEFDQDRKKYGHYGKRLRNFPFFTLNSNLRFNLPDLIQKNTFTAFYYNLGYVHEFFRDWEGLGKNNKPIIPTQIVHDLGLAYTFPKNRITLSFDAKNIFNRQVFDNWALQKPGRAFYVKLSFKII